MARSRGRLVRRHLDQRYEPISHLKGLISMLKIYFDKNVLSHIINAQRGAAETNGVTLDDVKSLLNAVAAGKIINLLSVMHLQEASYALRASSPSVAQDELQ